VTHRTCEKGAKMEVIVRAPIYTASLLLVVMGIMGTHYLVRMHSLFTPSNGDEYRIIGRYVTGTLSIVIPFSLMCWENGWYRPLAIIWSFAILAGICTAIFYGADRLFQSKKEAEAERGRGDAAVKDLESAGYPVE